MACFLQSYDRAVRHCGGRGQAHRAARQAPLAKKVAGAQNGDDRFFAGVGDDGELDLAFLDIRRWRPPGRLARKSLASYGMSAIVLPLPTLARKSLGIERLASVSESYCHSAGPEVLARAHP